MKSISELEVLIKVEEYSIASRLLRHFRNMLRRKRNRLILLTILILLVFINFVIFNNYEICNNNHEVAGWSKNTSRDIAEYLLPNQNTTLIDSNTCHHNQDPLLLLIVVCSSAGNFNARRAIRETWGNTTQFNYHLFDKFHGSLNGSFLNINSRDWRAYAEAPKNGSSYSQSIKNSNFRVNVVFLLGVSTLEDQQSIINFEHEKYGDIIQENFIESYNNLTLKSVFMLKWVRNNCIDKVKFIMKCDDDAFVNVPNLIHVLLGGTIPLYKSTISYHDKETVLVTMDKNRLPDTNKLLFGSKTCNLKKISDPRSNWYAPDYMYSGEVYPDFLLGSAYVFTNETAKALYSESFSVPLFHLEDVYLTGLVAEKLKLKRTHHPLFLHLLSRDKCKGRGLISQHKISPKNMVDLYNFVIDVTKNCPVPKKSFFKF